jgi:hypothetical protein
LALPASLTPALCRRERAKNSIRRKNRLMQMTTEDVR